MFDTPAILDTVFYWTGAIVWGFSVVYLGPLLPTILLAIVRRLAGRVEAWWSDYWWGGDLDLYEQKKDDGNWAALFEKHVLARVCRGSVKLADRYFEAILPVYSVLPGVRSE